MRYNGRQQEKSAPVIHGLNVSLRLLMIVGSAATELNNGVPLSAQSVERLIQVIDTGEDVFEGLMTVTRILNVSALRLRLDGAAINRRRYARLYQGLKSSPAHA